MLNKISTATVHIALQGEKSLVLSDHTSTSATFNVIGFIKPSVVLVDCRYESLIALHQILRTGNTYEFASKFNTLAEIYIEKDRQGNLLIHLDEPKNETSNYILWIAIGIKEYLPVYHYELCEIAPMDGDKFAIVSMILKESAYLPSDLPTLWSESYSK